MEPNETLEYIASIHDDQYLGIFERIDLNRESPIEIPKATRKHLSRWFRKLGFKVGAEVGVETGTYSNCLCKCNPGVKLYSIDAWAAYKGYREHVSQGQLDEFYEETKKRMAPYNCEVIKAFSLDAVKRFEDSSLDFVYIDCNHEFQQITNDIAEWSKKVRRGGIVAGHDFRRGSTMSSRSSVCHVEDVVRAWTNAYEIRPWFVLQGDNTPSWLWVRE